MNFKTRLFVILWAAGVVGVLSFLLVDLRALMAQFPVPAGTKIPPVTPALKLLSLVQPTVIFGLGHLPFVFAIIPNASVPLILYVIVGNSFVGLIVGYLYWKKGLESAMIAHMLAHVVMLAAIFFGV
jgi:Type II CAAX prenyl endopeptidase Rce1-like